MKNRLRAKKHCLLMFVFLIAVNLLNLMGTEPQEKDKKESEVFTHPSFIDEIVVEGEAIKETATVQQIDAKEIRDKGAKTVAEALQLIPGTYIQTGGKGEASIYIRGFSQREVTVLMDGIPLSSPYDGQIDLSGFPVEAIERIEVVKGASSVLYGANAMGGVVNIITKKSDGKNRIILDTQLGDGKTADINAFLQGAFGKIRYLVTGNYDNREYYRLSKNYSPAKNQPGFNRDNSDKKVWSGKISLGWDIGKEGKAALSYNLVDQVRGIPHHESDPKAKFWRFTDWQDGIVDFELHNTIGSVSYKTKLFYQYFNNILDSYDDITYSTQKGKNAFTDTYKDYSYGGDAFFRLGVKDIHLFKLALRFRHDTHRGQSNIGQPWLENHMNTLSLPLEGEWKPARLFTLTYGASVDFMFLSAREKMDARTGTSFNPQIAGIVHFTDTLSLRFSASRKTRFPSLKELFSSTSGNPNLDPMKSNIFELGLEYFPMPALSLSVVGFYNDVKGLINRVSKDTPYVNVDRAVFKGIETGVEWQFLTDSRLSLAYTFMHSEDKTTQNLTYIQYRPKNKIDAALLVSLPYRFKFNLGVGYVSSQVYYDSKNVEHSLKSYTLVDARLSKNFGERITVFLNARNLFDANYYETEGYPLEGRMIYGGIQVKIL